MYRALEKKIIWISGRNYHPKPLSFEGLLVAASYVYEAIAALRNRLYRSGCLVTRKLPCTVISVGNITAGGTGKTPMTIYLADLLTRLGHKPVVISRGYGGNLKTGAKIVGNGIDLFLDADQAGDEPHMMARMKQFSVVVGKNRYQAGLLALDRLAPDAVVLDDGFQHIQLKKDIDLLLMDHDKPLGNGRILPAGRLREPVAPAFSRADAVILTRCPEHRPDKPHMISLLAPNLPIFFTRHQPFLAAFYVAKNVGSAMVPGLKHSQYLHSAPYHGYSPGQKDTLGENNEVVQGLGVFTGRLVFLFSGIAHNTVFHKTIRDLGGNIRGHLEFDDHYRYKVADILRIQHQAKALGAQIVVTTQKDWVKLDPRIQWPMDLAVVGIRMKFENTKDFEHFIETRLSR